MLRGSIVALITPMDKKGNICITSLKKLIDYHVKSKTSALVAVGTTGESATLSYEEHSFMIQKTLNLSNGRIPVIAGTGSNSTEECIYFTKKFENSGIIACLNVTPYYNRPTQEGLYQHFKAIAENTSLPQLLYNVPSRTGCDLLPETVGRLSYIPNIIGIKEASGDLLRINIIKEISKKNFILLSGDDISALDFMQLGGHGVISVTANIAATQMVKICNLAKNNHFDLARKINNNLNKLHKVLFIEPNPIPVKWVAKIMGLISTDTMRLPMTPITKASCLTIKKILHDLHIL